MRARQADIGALLSAKSTETANAVHRVYEEYTALKFAHFGLCSQLFDTMAQLVTPGEDAIRIVNGLDPDGLHRLAVRLSEATSGLCAALNPHRQGHRLLPGSGRRRCPRPDQSPEHRPQWPGRRQARHLPGQLRRHTRRDSGIFEESGIINTNYKESELL